MSSLVPAASSKVPLPYVPADLGLVILELKKRLDASKLGIMFEGKTKTSTDPTKPVETQLFRIQDILWDAVPSKGKSPAKSGVSDVMNGSNRRKTLGPTSEAGQEFLFAIKWPKVNFPPNIPPGRSIVETEYVLRAFLQVSGDTKDTFSEPRYIEFQPHIDPFVATGQMADPPEKRVIVKDDSKRVLGEAALTCKATKGTLFGYPCPFSLMLLIRHSDSKALPRRAKVEVFEIHKCVNGQGEQWFALSRELVLLPPDLVRCHHECTIPLQVQIPVPEIDSKRGATGLPTMVIDGLQVEHLVRVTIPLYQSRFSSLSKTKAIVVDCPVTVGNFKPKDRRPAANVPRLVINTDEENVRDSSSLPVPGQGDGGGKRIVQWSDTCEIPVFLPGGDIEEDYIL